MKKILSLCTALLLFGSMTIQAAEDVYRVAGSSNLFGSNWSTTDDNNKMTLQNGKYRLVKENTSSSAQSVEFKVVKNGSWNYAYPSSNYSISVPGNTKLLITYTTSGNAVNAQILGGYVGAHGTMTSSSWATVQFTAASNKETASHTYNLKAGTYQFGMRVGANNNWTSNGSSFTRTNNSRMITSGSGNCSLTANVDGDYTFTWTYETNTLTITYPPQAGEYDITATTATHWTYGSLPTSKTSGQNVQFTVTPDAGYSVEVSSSDVTIAKNGNTYSFTMPNKAVAITVVATAIPYDIIYPASPAHYTLASGNPTSGTIGQNKQFTVTPDAHYLLTVTANGTALVGANNVYSFTMPAQDVTIAVAAQSLRHFDGSTPLYLNAAHVDWWMDASAVQKATFTKEDNTTVEVVGVLDEGNVYAFTPAAGYYKSVKFSRHNPSNVSEDWGHTENVSLIGTDAHNYVSAFAQNSSTVTWGTFTPSPSYIFTSGTTIYYDLTQYGGGINTYVCGTELWHPSTSGVLSIELTSDWKVTASTKLFRSGPNNNWGDRTCATLPTEGQNMIVSTDGITCHWDTYVPPVNPTVDFVSLGNTIALGTTAKFSATSTNIDNPVYKFYVKKGSGDYSAAVTSFNFDDDSETYTVKVEVDGDESKHAEATKDITVVDGAHVIYFVNHADWAQVYAHMWGAEPGTVWPGDTMTYTSLVTDKNNYPVYAVTFTPNYTDVKFNNGLGVESADQTLDYSKPYYYNGQWYATLAECDPITVTLSGLTDSYLVGANATLSATSNLTNASYSYEVKIDEGEYVELENNPYTFAVAGEYTFKVTATGDEGSKSATQTVTVYEPLTLYFVNKEGWTNVKAYFYTPEKATWPGETMTLTAETTARHSYKVYSSPTIGLGAHANVIFNNGNGAQTGDLTINAAKPYYYDGEWYATLAEIDPETYVDFSGVNATISLNTPLTLAATSNVTNPTYLYYAKPEGGAYAAITSPHTFDAAGKYTLKVEALENGEGDPVAVREKDIEVYTTYTFNNGTAIYVDFSAMTEGAKGVNFPFADKTDPLDYDGEGAGTHKTIYFTADVEWSTLQDFIKTEKNSWAGLHFTVPEAGQNVIVVAADGASYTWGTVTPETYHLYVRDLTGWNTFKTYAWGDKEYFGTWDDGGAANSTTTIDGATYNVYDFQAVAGYPINMNIIFHNGTDQLDDYQVTEAKDYYFTVTNDAAWEGLVGLKRFRTCEPIEHLYGYQFDENGTVGAEWPGAELTANGEGWYEFIVNKGRTLIFNTGTGEGAMQTGDLAYTEADPVADECAVWQGETNVADNKTYMVTSDNPDAPCILIYERNVTAGNYGTICLPYEALSVSGATLYSISGSNDNGIFIDQESSLLKGVPYIFLASEDKITVRYWDGQSFTPSVDNLYTTNGLVGFIGENESAEYTVTPDAHNFILYQNGLYYVDSPAKIRSNRAYIDWSNLPGEPSAPAPGRQRRVIGVHQTPTAIDQIYEPASMKNGKYMINGQLFIINNGMIYNAQGQIVK